MSDPLSRVTEYLHHYPNVSAAWLFGSMATGKAGKNSDMDIAILFTPDLSKYERFDLRLLIGGELARLAEREVDVVDMAAAPLYLQHQVRKTGRLIVEKDHAYRVAFDIRSRREYFDLAPVLELRNRRLIERSIGGSENG
ncbi:putative nucleotidyltransferase [Hydrogenispora ethanolica]|uniref:Putative nucleotidyltransferase n=1 Tax=Hydrogenispora ethanolica TaxID=1082276 RepID=A0A4R1RRA5_HYDET|nr:nucleotidyltransferase domain-containing protein [Hydrogenispora ethanolica]TCL68462.1 putative nucleotidyltransferase [Hydrogenispora ethanolica]